MSRGVDLERPDRGRKSLGTEAVEFRPRSARRPSSSPPSQPPRHADDGRPAEDLVDPSPAVDALAVRNSSGDRRGLEHQADAEASTGSPSPPRIRRRTRVGRITIAAKIVTLAIASAQPARPPRRTETTLSPKKSFPRRCLTEHLEQSEIGEEDQSRIDLALPDSRRPASAVSGPDQHLVHQRDRSERDRLVNDIGPDPQPDPPECDPSRQERFDGLPELFERAITTSPIPFRAPGGPPDRAADQTSGRSDRIDLADSETIRASATVGSFASWGGLPVRR